MIVICTEVCSVSHRKLSLSMAQERSILSMDETKVVHNKNKVSTADRRHFMGMTGDGLSYWQAESEGLSLLETTMGDLLDRRATEIPTQEAVVYSCYPEFGEALNLRWTYQEYRERANQVAKGLIALGLHKGDHIAVLAANLPEWPLLMMGAAKAGLVLVTINPVLREAEIEYILKQGDVQALFLMARVRDYDHLTIIRSLTTPAQQNGEVTS